MSSMPASQQLVPTLLYEFDQTDLLGAHAHLDDLGSLRATRLDMDAFTKQWWRSHDVTSHTSYQFVNEALRHFQFVPERFALKLKG